MFAIILDRNKQYLVKQDIVIKVDLLDANVDDIISSTDILLFNNGECAFLGSPFVDNKVVKLQVLDHIKDKKKYILKFKRRKHHMKQKGHRQNYTLLKVIFIGDK